MANLMLSGAMVVAFAVGLSPLQPQPVGASGRSRRTDWGWSPPTVPTWHGATAGARFEMPMAKDLPARLAVVLGCGERTGRGRSCITTPSASVAGSSHSSPSTPRLWVWWR